MRHELLKIAAEYTIEKSNKFGDNALAAFIRASAPSAVKSVVDSLFGKGFKIAGSPGQGAWANVPWIGVFNPAITTTATRGYYVVYLFSANMRRVYLSLNQGTTAVEQEFKTGYRAELKRRAQLANSRLGMLSGGMTDAAIHLESTATLPEGYEAGHIRGYGYDISDLPPESVLADHLSQILLAYLQLHTLGGVSDLISEEDEEGAEGETVEERRRYRQHRSIERNPDTSRKVKKALGYICQCCGFDFEKAYGKIGHQYIEAHHLIHLSSLPPNILIPMDVKKDFAVLCANCHRMMHRKNGPKTLAELKVAHKIPELTTLFK